MRLIWTAFFLALLAVALANKEAGIQVDVCGRIWAAGARHGPSLIFEFPPPPKWWCGQ